MTTDQLNELMEAHQAELYRYVKFLGATHAIAEDILQETFIGAFRAAKQPDLDHVAQRKAWLRGIARNQFLSHCRKNRRSPVQFSSETVERAEEVWQTSFLPHDDGFGYMEALQSCLGNLPAKQRKMLDGFYRDKLSRVELGNLLAMSEEGIKSALRRTRAALKQCVTKQLEQA